ncbi:MAG: ATP-binding protein [Gemmatimonadaceae bacterium]
MGQSPRPSAQRWAWWAAAAGAGLLSGSQWLHASGVEYLVVWLVATIATVATALRIKGAERRWALACAALLAIGVGIAAPAQRNLSRISKDWEGWRHDAATSGLVALKSALDAAASDAIRTSHDALTLPRDRSRAFEALSFVQRSRDERGAVVYRGDSAFAWGGVVRPTIDPVHDGVTVIGTTFYLGLQFSERDEGTRAVTVILLDAAPPADRLSAPLAPRVASERGLRGFLFSAPLDTTSSPEVLRYALGEQRLFDVRAYPLVQGEISQTISERARARAGIAFALALACFIIGVWRGTRRFWPRVIALGVGLACTALIPLNQYSNLTRLFDPAVYFTPKGGPLTANAGALVITAAVVLLGVLGVFRRQARRASTPGAVVTILLVAGLGPFLLRELARGVAIPPHGVDGSLWLIWEVPLFLAAVSVLLAGAAAGSSVLGTRRGLPPWVAPSAAGVAAMLAPVVWDAPGRWPWWYALLWVAAIGMLAMSRRTRYVILSASAVAAFGATTLVWARTARGRVDAAERDLAGLTETDSVSASLLRRFGATLADVAPTTRQSLLQRYVMSDISSSGNPVAISAWPTDSGPTARFQTADIPLAMSDEALMVSAARQSGRLIFGAGPTDTAVELVMAVPSVSGSVTSVVMAPKSRLFERDPYAQLLGLDVDADAEPPYTVRLRTLGPADSVFGEVVWRRDGSVLHGDWAAAVGAGTAAAHVEVELRPLDALVERGALIVLLDLAIVAALWFASVVADGGANRWIRARRRTWGRSYRARLSLALFAFFVMPAAAFAVWSYGQLATDATRSRELLVSETLRALSPPPNVSLWLPAESERLDAPLFLYRRGELSEASDPLYDELAPVGRYLDPAVELNLGVRGEETTTRLDHIDGSSTLFGYRAFESGDSMSSVLAAPARADELALGRRRRDLGVLVLFATAVGALAALWLSGIAARQLASPIGELRDAAISIAGGRRALPFRGEPMVEFGPVFTAFRGMAADLNASTTALEDAQRRTAAVLRNVASGVVAIDFDGRVVLANPRAEALLGTSLEAGPLFASVAPAAISSVVERFLRSGSDDENFEASLDHQQIRGTLTRLGRGKTGTSLAVVTLDDVTELARAQRVLAWGEMARQVAHEIKNPLTPIRLGVQHLRRARADKRVDFDRVLEHNVNLILTEIDRLDEIARAFSRYGAAPDERPQPSSLDVAAVVREVVSLERMGEETALSWTEHGVDYPVLGLARSDELKEVLLNLLENARHANAKNVDVSVSLDGEEPERRVMIAVRDDGQGIPADVLSRVFEPHFSTRTSGSGLGLAISRRLVEGWGGEVTLESAEGQGATVTIALKAVAVARTRGNDGTA